MSTIKPIKPLNYLLLRSKCDPNNFSFTSSADIPDLEEFVGQSRALDAARFGICIARDGFNIFALGPKGVGKLSIMQALLKQQAQSMPSPHDACYVHNFEKPNSPRLLLLPQGLGQKLSRDMSSLVEILKTSIPAIFDMKEFAQRIKEIDEKTQKKESSALKKLEDAAQQQDVAILRTAEGFVLAPTHNQELISEADFQKLPKEEREIREKNMEELRKQLTNYLNQISAWNKEHRKEVKEALKYFTMLQVGNSIDDIKKNYQHVPEVITYLEQVQKAILDNPTDFRKQTAGAAYLMAQEYESSSLNRYKVNVFVDNSKQSGAPVVYEDNPSVSNLVGQIDHISRLGALTTDFSLIKSGALQKANGGFLVLDAYKVLTQPFAWSVLKRSLRAKKIVTENINQMLGFLGSVTLEPEPLALQQKVILLGDRRTYYMLCQLDPEFLELFKVAADFDEEIDRNPKNEFLFAQLLKKLSKKENLKPLSKA
ncbi:MAG: AAA family ATPase, partial [Myxococcales bacterium]|nr:AAA family ATPase [Myxococcales bacterium]